MNAHRQHYRTTPKRSTEFLRGLALAIVIGIIGALVLQSWSLS